MKVSYEGVAEQVATFQVDGASNPAVQVGTVVALSGNGTVKACPASTATGSGWCWGSRMALPLCRWRVTCACRCAAALTVGYAQLAPDGSGRRGGGRRPGTACWW